MGTWGKRLGALAVAVSGLVGFASWFDTGAASAQTGVAGPTQVTLPATPSSITVDVVNASPRTQKLHLHFDASLRKAVKHFCARCDRPVAPGAAVTIKLTRKTGSSGGGGNLTIVGLVDRSALVIAVTVDPAPAGSPEIQLPSGVTRKTYSDFFCRVEPLFASEDFTAKQATLAGPEGTAPLAIINWKVATVGKDECAKAFEALRQGSPLPTSPKGADTEPRVLVVARGLHLVGEWSTTVKLDPAATDEGAVTFTFERTRGPWFALFFILLGSALASVLGLFASWLLPKLQENRKRGQVIADAEDRRVRLRRAVRAARGVSPEARRDIEYAWAASAKQITEESSLEPTERDRRAGIYAHAGTALEDLLNQLHYLMSRGHADSRLAATLITAAKDAPDLSRSGEPAIVEAAAAASAWVTVVREVDRTIRQLPARHVDLDDIRNEALANEDLGPTNMPDGLLVKVTEVQQGLPIQHDRGAIVVNALTAGDLDLSGLGSRPAVRRRRLVEYRAAATRARRVSVVAEIVAAVLALAAAAAVALTAQYYAKDAWGTTGDMWASATWAFGASGVVQVSKLFLVGGPSITAKSD